jgi:hypothetical protein
MASPGGVFVRRTEFDDVQSIQALVGDDHATYAKRFGPFDITSLIETASLGITAPIAISMVCVPESSILE